MVYVFKVSHCARVTGDNCFRFLISFPAFLSFTRYNLWSSSKTELEQSYQADGENCPSIDGMSVSTGNSKDTQAQQSSKRNAAAMADNVRESKKIRELLAFEAHADGLRNEIRSWVVELSTYQAERGCLEDKANGLRQDFLQYRNLVHQARMKSPDDVVEMEECLAIVVAERDAVKGKIEAFEKLEATLRITLNDLRSELEAFVLTGRTKIVPATIDLTNNVTETPLHREPVDHDKTPRRSGGSGGTNSEQVQGVVGDPNDDDSASCMTGVAEVLPPTHLSFNTSSI